MFRKSIGKSQLGNFGQQIGEIEGNVRYFFVGGPNLKIFESKMSLHIFTIQMSIVSNFEAKGSKSLDFIASSVFKNSDQKNFIPRATLHPKMAINFERNYPQA